MEQMTSVEGETPVISEVGVVEGETPVISADVDVGVKKGATPVDNVEGETPVGDLEGATPVISKEVVGGETPEKLAGGEALISDTMVAEGETPVYIEGATPILSEEGETFITTEASEPKKSGLEVVIELDDQPVGADLPMDKREARRRARRNLKDEIEDLTLSTKEEVQDLGTEGELEKDTPRSGGEEEEDEEERRLTAKRKMKGKKAAPSLVKKTRKPSGGKSIEVSLPPPVKVPYAREPVSPARSSESEEEPEEELNFEPAEVWITKGLLDAMRKFEDPKRAATYKERSGPGKLATSGKRYDPAELKEIDSDEEFRQYIDAIGFDWLLKHISAEVPKALAREFFLHSV
ncbi:uncharacterized protein LOC121752797 [Salvia splendens]|uniref:uncharacterized protein LOC121752797 n=1 Tax=Salvia splendens TaxID=180675 RepID=UPI001C261939|nr:uncharacterized protein LOC121752797 [Salvia splendens]